jgi:galactokinase
MTCPFTAEALLEAARDEEEFFRHCAAVAYEMLQMPQVTGGIELVIDRMDLPLKKGVSSSAAVSVLLASAFDRVYKLGLFPHELMELAYLGERMTGSQCGRMDQACIFGKTPVLLMFQGASEVRIEPVFPGVGVEMFFVDLAGKKDTVRILADLQSAYLKHRSLQEALGARIEKLVRAAYRALSAGDGPRLGELMTEAQALFDAHVAPHCPQELESPLLHQVLTLPAVQPHVFGGKGVGSQGDGTAQFVARSADDRDAAMRIIEQAFPTMRCFPLTIVAAMSRI